MHHDHFISGIGYSDGYFHNNSKPLLWKYWSHEERLLYQKSCAFGSYSRFRHDSKRVVNKHIAIWRALCML